MSLLQEMQTHGLADCPFNRDLLKSKAMTYEQWEVKYQPILNHLDQNASDKQHTFETYGVEVGFVLGVNYVDPKLRIPAQRDRPFQQYDRSFQIDRDR